MTALAEHLWSLCEVDPVGRAVCFEDRWWSWGELTDCAKAVDAELTAAGAGPGQRVAVVLENRPEFVAVLLAVLGRDRCLTAVSPLQPTRRLMADLRAARVGVLIAAPSVWQRLAGEETREETGARGYRLAHDGSLELIGDAAVHPDLAVGTAIEMLTSGTTGPPKRVALGYSQLFSSLRSADHYSGVDTTARPRLSTGVGVTATPLVHIGGLWGVLKGLDGGRGTVLLERFRVQPWVAAVERYEPRVTGLVPAAMQMVLDADVPRERLASLRAVNSGAAPLSPDLAEAFADRSGITVLSVYGATEFCGAIAGWTMRDHREHWAAKRGSVGRAQPGVELRVVDDAGEPVPPSVQGRLQVRTAHSGPRRAAPHSRAQGEQRGVA